MKLRAAIRAYRSGRVHDASLYATFRTAPADVADQFEPLQGYFPEVDVEALQQLPAGTLGREYARFLVATGIEHPNFSTAARQEFHTEAYTVRSFVTHDFYHVLSGFDTGLAGELGVLALTSAQGSLARGFVVVGQIFASLISPTQAGRIRQNVRAGTTIGKQAKLLSSQRIEDQFARPLAEVRADYNIPDPAAVGVCRSTTSWFCKLLAPNVNPVVPG